MAISMEAQPWAATGTRGGVACSTPEAAQAGLEILSQGGSAADANIAAAFVQTGVEDGSTSLAGAFFMQIHYPGADTTEFASGVFGPAAQDDYDGYSAATLDRLGGRAMPAPGFVGGAWIAHQRFGRLPWSRILEPARLFAREGFAVGAAWLSRLRFSTDSLRDPASQKVWMDGGRILSVGSVVRQTELADTLDGILDGPDARPAEWSKNRRLWLDPF